ncbi:hypothetical protein DES53_11590 [Roseimicrobium gellanilyticum]|uniref:Uncharacterized protein n=1 Tax=Roseimicrobium gellanilyticum TaxID=748857 RepID=A0A366H4W3_9BACT|nr:hypothetical protein [Roseimicrobium gellanilyticum]RBP36949.1 hypothetical protein DES53_11590 [Roseimicrobium gellanilyticum]
MSRRKIYLLMALFVLLVGIPATYICFTMYPRNPLRFRLVGVHPTTDHSYFRNVVQMEVINTSPVPVRLTAATVRGGSLPTGPILTSFGEIVHTHVSGRVDADGTLYPGARILSESYGTWPEGVKPDQHNIHVLYLSHSSTEGKISALYWSIVTRLPESWRKKAPKLRSQWNTAPLEISP